MTGHFKLEIMRAALLTTDFILAVKIIQIMLLVSMMLITLLGDLELVVQEESMQPTQQYLQFWIKD